MRPYIYAVVAISFPLNGAIWADDRPALPKGAAPEFIQIVSIDKEKVVIQACTTGTQGKGIPQEISVGGRKIVQQVGGGEATVSMETHKLATLRLLDAQGKEIKGDDAWKKLGEGKVLLRQVGEEPIDPAYLKLLGKDTFILAPKPAHQLKTK
jgi:hypothetical protein